MKPIIGTEHCPLLRIVGALLLGTVTSCLGAGVGRASLGGHRPLAAAMLPSSGSLNPTNRIRLAIGLPLRNQADLDATLRQLYDPADPQYRKFLSPEEFTSRFGPSEEDCQGVIQFIKSYGLSVIGRHQNRVVLDVEGSVADIQRAFQIAINTFRHPTEAREFFAPDTEPYVPANLPVADLWGLSDYARPTLLLRATEAPGGLPFNPNRPPPLHPTLSCTITNSPTTQAHRRHGYGGRAGEGHSPMILTSTRFRLPPSNSP